MLFQGLGSLLILMPLLLGHGTSRSVNRLLKRSRFKSIDRVERPDLRGFRTETDMKIGSEDSKGYFRTKWRKLFYLFAIFPIEKSPFPSKDPFHILSLGPFSP
jgi:hypothetical protein